MGTMATGKLIILSAVLFAQALSAPSGCIESCNFYEQTSSYQNRQTGNYQDHAGLVQGGTSLNDHDYVRPGNWTERNQYNTDGGRGKVHEERGQYVEGSKRVRYYKKNFTSSSGNVNALTDLGSQHRYDSLHLPSSQHLESPFREQELGQTVTKESGYSRVHSQQSSSRVGGQSERLEDFGEYGGQHGVHVQSVTPENWSRVDSHRNVLQELDQFRREFHQQTAGLAQEAARSFHGSDLQTAESENSYGHHQASSGYRRVYPSTGTVRHYSDQQQAETFVDTGRQQLVHPNTNYGQTESQRNYQSQESYVSRVHPVPQPSYPVQVTGGNYQAHSYSGGRHHVDESQRAEISSAHQNRLFTERVHNPHPTYSSRRDENRHYQEEHWQSSGGSLVPERSTDLTGLHGIGSRVHNEQRGSYHSTAKGYDSHVGSSYSSGYGSSSGQKLVAAGSALDLGRTGHGADCTEETHQHYQHETSYHRKYKRDAQHALQDQEFEPDSEKLNLTQQSEDFTQQDEELTQQDEELTQQTKGQLEFGHPHDFTQQNEEFAQMVSDQLARRLEQLRQQNKWLSQEMEGQLEFGQQTSDDQQQNERFTQQESNKQTQQTGKLEFDQQMVGNQHLKDLTQQNEQETEGQLEFGRQTFNDHHLTQENKHFMSQDYEDLTQQTSGKLEFDHQTVGDQQAEDLKQQTEQLNDYTQQFIDKLQFGQQTADDEHFTDSIGKLQSQSSDHLTQDNKHFMSQDYEDLTQQTSGKLEFDHQTVGDQQAEDLKQQTEQLNDYTQQFVNKLQFGQQTADDQHLTDSIGKLQSTDKPGNPKNQHLEEFDSEEFPQQGRHDEINTQQTTGQLEFGQHGPSNPKIDHHPEDFTQNEDLTQQVGGFGNFPPSGHLERSREQELNWPGYNPRHPEQFSQQNDWNVDVDLSQQSRYPSYDNNNNKQSDWQVDMSQQDFTQQTDDQQLARKPAPKPKPRPRYQQHDSSILSHTEGPDADVDDIFKPIEINPETDFPNPQETIIQHSGRLTDPRSERPRSDIPSQSPRSTVFDNEKENVDRLHWVHKSNDATVGLQWHYTYHPSDLTNIEGSQNSYYPHQNVDSQQKEDDTQQQSEPFDFSQQETQDQQTSKETHISRIPQVQRDQRDQQLGSFQQADASHFDTQVYQNSEQAALGVIPLHNSQTTEQTEHKMESRILEAYGGGPYDASRNDDIYRRVRPNPSATLPPIPGDEDPWDIREKPREIIPWTVMNTLPVASTPDNTATTTEKIEITTQIVEATTMEAPPSFWSRLGHKITRTYDKAKEKAKEYFG
ncbi:uncharacterized protein LOC114945426 [Nylanderia fulva]|uniref:uncharacterized protein LOC114945426 n=1 Tax=Nylanderia fulva TaxID=613905 RepID=UPI0010FB1FD6|nr:uncharacterized protein LOC114945426 [Nylanderia fulva]